MSLAKFPIVNVFKDKDITVGKNCFNRINKILTQLWRHYKKVLVMSKQVKVFLLGLYDMGT